MLLKPLTLKVKNALWNRSSHVIKAYNIKG